MTKFKIIIFISSVFFSKSAVSEWKYIDKIKQGFFDTSISEYYYEPSSIRINGSKVKVTWLLNNIKQTKDAKKYNVWKSSVSYHEIQCMKNNKGDIWTRHIRPMKTFKNLMASGKYKTLDLTGKKIYIKFERATKLAKYICEKYVYRPALDNLFKRK